MQLGKCYEQQEKFQEALRVYQDALDFSPENPELLTTMGLLWLRQGDSARAVLHLGNAMTHDPRSAKAILGWGSITQDNQDMDVALVKYRIAAVATPNSAQLWNNIGMCFFGKQRFVAAIACLKPRHLDPFEGSSRTTPGSCTSTRARTPGLPLLLRPRSTSSLTSPASYWTSRSAARLDDFENSCSAYEKAMGMEEDHMTHLNFAITLYNFGEVSRAKEEFRTSSACSRPAAPTPSTTRTISGAQRARARARARAPLHDSPRVFPPRLTRAFPATRAPGVGGIAARPAAQLPSGRSGPC